MDCPASRPTIDVIVNGGSASRQLSPRTVGVDGIQHDLAGPFALWNLRPGNTGSETNANLTALWLPRCPGGFFVNWQQNRILRTAWSVAEGLGPHQIVVDCPTVAETSRRRVIPSTAARYFGRVRAELPPNARIAIALRPNQLSGGRTHLNDLGRLRRFAEEWDVDIALDLSAPVDRFWEAEAAIWRLTPRLQIVRFGALNARFGRRTEPRLAARVLAALADGGYAGRIAIAPKGPVAPWRQDGIREETRLIARLVSCRFDNQGSHDQLAWDSRYTIPR